MGGIKLEITNTYEVFQAVRARTRKYVDVAEEECVNFMEDEVLPKLRDLIDGTELSPYYIRNISSEFYDSFYVEPTGDGAELRIDGERNQQLFEWFDEGTGQKGGRSKYWIAPVNGKVLAYKPSETYVAHKVNKSGYIVRRTGVWHYGIEPRYLRDRSFTASDERQLRLRIDRRIREIRNERV